MTDDLRQIIRLTDYFTELTIAKDVRRSVRLSLHMRAMHN